MGFYFPTLRVVGRRKMLQLAMEVLDGDVVHLDIYLCTEVF